MWKNSKGVWKQCTEREAVTRFVTVRLQLEKMAIGRSNVDRCMPMRPESSGLKTRNGNGKENVELG